MQKATKLNVLSEQPPYLNLIKQPEGSPDLAQPMKGIDIIDHDPAGFFYAPG